MQPQKNDGLFEELRASNVTLQTKAIQSFPKSVMLFDQGEVGGEQKRHVRKTHIKFLKTSWTAKKSHFL